MPTHSGPNLIEDGLVLSLDAGDKNSYPLSGLDIEYLIVAGGGGSQGHNSGGAGAGGVVMGKNNINNQSYSVVVGAGGSGASANPTNGSNSSAFGITALGGGHSGIWSVVLPSSGGSGAGGNAYSAPTQPSYTNGKNATQPTSTDGGFGNKGGNGYTNSTNRAGGGGGGAGESGKNAVSGQGGDGGDGIFSSITGISKYYAGGGGGAHRTSSFVSQGGLGGGGDGESASATKTSNSFGSQNTGGGAGAIELGANPSAGRSGGSGIVVIRYKGKQKATGGDLIYRYKNYTVHVFENSDNFVVGNTITDITGNQNPVTLQNGVGSSTDNLGVLDFDGVDDYIDLGTQLNSLTTFAVEGVFKTDLTSGDTYQNIWGAGTDNSTVGISIGNFTSTYSNESFHVVINGATYQAYIRKGSGFYFDGKYHHFVVNIEPGNNTIYIDGELQSITYRYGNINTDTGGLVGISNNNSYIGRRGYSASPGYFNGKIPLLRIYNRGLTNQEVSNNYNSLKSRFGL